ncbi:TonB-dependent receptor plug domain-containing protein [Hymenobacter tenuis]
MPQLLPLALFLPLSIPALAQQPDTLAVRRVGVEMPSVDSLQPINSDIVSLLSGRLLCSTVGVPVQRTELLSYPSLQEQLRQVAGVQATLYSGAPGTQVAVRIRGVASMGRNVQPLYVVDGVPVWQHHTVLHNGSQNILISSYELNPSLSLLGQDIATVEVVKGAYETAEYGAQGQNGVIRITTRTGQAGKPRVSYTGYAGVQQARFRYDLLNAEEYASLANEEMASYGQPPRYTPAQIAAFGRGTDWQREVLRTASIQQQQVALRGGSARTTYYTSVAYGQQQGIVQNSRLRTLNLRATATHTFTPKLTLRGTVTSSEQLARLPPDGLIADALLALPTQLARTPNGELATTDYRTENPLRHALLSYQTPRQRYLLGQLQLRYTVLPYLTLELQGAQEYIQQKTNAYQAPQAGTASELTLKQQAAYRQWSVLPALRFKRTWAGQHQLQLALLGQYQNQEQDQQRTTYGGPQESASYTTHLPNSLTSSQLTGSYSFRERYEVQASLRRDDAQSYAMLHTLVKYIPGAQLKWHARKESWLPTLSLVSTLDAWIGWGATTNAGNFAADNTLAFALSAANGYGSRVVPLDEYTRQREAGLTVGLWQDQVLLTSAAYDRSTEVSGLVANIFNPQQPSQQRSYAQLRNQGWELTAATQWHTGRVQATSTLGIAFNRNRYVAGEVSAILAGGKQWARDGEPLSTFYTLHYAGINTNGRPRYQDVDGNGSIDFQVAGSGLPRQLLSFTQTLDLGRFSLQAQADGMFGYKVDTPYLRFLGMPNAFTNSTRETLNHWTPDNLTSDLPRAGEVAIENSDFSIQSGNHVRLTAFTVRYTVWKKEARTVSLWAAGHNLLVISGYQGYDPNVSSGGADPFRAGLDAGAYPTARTILLGVQATL